MSVGTFFWFNVYLQLAALIWLLCLARRVDFAAEKRARCDRWRAEGFGHCEDCSSDWCPCWKYEQDRRSLALKGEDYEKTRHRRVAVR